MKKHLRVIYIRPSTYDDDGYVLRFWRGVVPSNTLACLDSLTRALAATGELGSDVEVTTDLYDDTLERIPVKRIARLKSEPDTQVVVGFVGVQSNQFPRAVDLALELRAHGVQVMIGGFHVSGMLALFDEPTHDLRQCLDNGISIVKGEAEAPGALAGILKDALAGEMKPIYDIREFPDLEHAPVPAPSDKFRGRFFRDIATIDTSRGCPFNCTFCTIINVQGRKMRHRSAACVLKAIEENYERGVRIYFFTDDNFSRNPVWEEVLDGLIAMRERGMEITFMMQTDTQAHKIPNFVEKAARAGCYMVFIGMETVNPKNLEAIGKHQNHVEQYAAMSAMWRDNGISVHVGYIIGLPHDTPESVRADIECLKNEVMVDKASLFMLVPLPGSKDHWQMVQDHVPMDADYNNFDSLHETFRHPKMAPGQWRAVYQEAMESFFSKENITNVLLRTPASRYYSVLWLLVWYRYSALEGYHPMTAGVFRLKDRKSRRPLFERENVFRYAWRRLKDGAHGFRRYGGLLFDFQEIWLLSRKPEDVRWATLADLRMKWALARQRIRECDVRGRCDVAAQEVRATLAATAERMRQLAEARSALGFRARRGLRKKVRDIEAYLRTFELHMPNWRQVLEAERFSENAIAAYEELTIRYVAKCRRFNAYRREMAERFKTGRLLTMDVNRILYAFAFEMVFFFRFGTIVFSRVLNGR